MDHATRHGIRPHNDYSRLGRPLGIQKDRPEGARRNSRRNPTDAQDTVDIKANTGITSLSEIDWPTWQAIDPATLVYVVESDRVLLIRKKRGLGAGKINAPGGRIEEGETIEECAVREIREELLITPHKLEWIGENRFQFVDGYSLHAHVFRASTFTGTPTETDEAIPLWFPISELPYEEMWEDDRLWVPHVLSRTRFSARYIFDGDRMLDHAIELID